MCVCVLQEETEIMITQRDYSIGICSVRINKMENVVCNTVWGGIINRTGGGQRERRLFSSYRLFLPYKPKFCFSNSKIFSSANCLNLTLSTVQGMDYRYHRAYSV